MVEKPTAFRWRLKKLAASLPVVPWARDFHGLANLFVKQMVETSFRLQQDSSAFQRLSRSCLRWCFLAVLRSAIQQLSLSLSAKSPTQQPSFKCRCRLE